MAVSERRVRDRLTRRQALQGAGGVAALALASGGVAELLAGSKPSRPSDPSKALPHIPSFADKPSGRQNSFRSQPDLRPPTVTTNSVETAERLRQGDPRFLFLGPGPVALSGNEQYGPMIVARDGAPVWFRPLTGGLQVSSFFSTTYQGEPVLVWWEGKIQQTGYGQGEAVLLDRSYREVTRVRAAGGRSMDLHALTVTPHGTALFTCYPETVQMDLSAINGPRDTQVLESIIQEVDIASGRLLFEWRGLQHIPVTDSHEPMSQPYDYLHINSIQALPDGNLLVSARHTWAVYKLDRRSGAVIWTLGGKRSQFRMGIGSEFAWQHDALLWGKVLTVFDNETNGPIDTERQSRGLALEVNESRRTVNMRDAYTSSRRPLAGAMGSVQILPSGRVFVGWGVESFTSEFTAEGRPLFDVSLPPGLYSYRGLWLDWEGTPYERPAAVAARDPNTGSPMVYASWNGATNVAAWRVAAGSSRNDLRPVGIARHHAFETVIQLSPGHRYASLTALDRSGKPLKRSPTIRL
jgi:Arylsulfotransferase (ASST)